MKLFSALALSVLFSQASMAAVLELAPGTNSIKGVNVALGAKATVEGRKFDLALAGAGLRAKKVVVFNVDVYVAQLFVSDRTQFTRTPEGAADSIDKMNQVAIQLHFLRGVDAKTVQTSFAEALDANDVNQDATEIKQFMDAVSSSGDAANGKDLTLVGEKIKDDKGAVTEELVTYENNQGATKTIHGPAGFVKTIFKIWLGNSADSGVADLKKSILAGGN